MKKTLLFLITILTFIFSNTAYADVSSTTSSKINEIKQKIVEIKQEVATEKTKADAELASTTNAKKSD